MSRCQDSSKPSQLAISTKGCGIAGNKAEFWTLGGSNANIVRNQSINQSDSIRFKRSICPFRSSRKQLPTKKCSVRNAKSRFKNLRNTPKRSIQCRTVSTCKTSIHEAHESLSFVATEVAPGKNALSIGTNTSKIETLQSSVSIQQ